MEREVRRTMKQMSVKEKERQQNLNFMVPMDIPGRHQLMTKLKDLVVRVDNIIVKPVSKIPTIKNVCPFFSSDGFWKGNFIAYGTDTSGKEILLWDDIVVDEMEHEETSVDTNFIKAKLSYNEKAVIIVARDTYGVVNLEFYYYLPETA